MGLAFDRYMADLLYNRSFFSCRDKLNVCVNQQQLGDAHKVEICSDFSFNNSHHPPRFRYKMEVGHAAGFSLGAVRKFPTICVRISQININS